MKKRQREIKHKMLKKEKKITQIDNVEHAHINKFTYEAIHIIKSMKNKLFTMRYEIKNKKLLHGKRVKM